jgi:hypothetical protein
MNFERSIFVPNSPQNRDKRMALVSALITLFGILFFKWSISDVVFLFFWEMLLFGASTVLRMLFALAGMRHFFQGLLLRLFWTAGFTVLYATMLMLLIAFVLSGLNLESMLPEFRGLRYGIWFLAFNHIAGFLFGYILNDEYKRSSFFLELFATMIFALPTVVILVLVISPNTGLLGVEHQNTLLAIAIVLIRLVIELVATRLRLLLYGRTTAEVI